MGFGIGFGGSGRRSNKGLISHARIKSSYYVIGMAIVKGVDGNESEGNRKENSYEDTHNVLSRWSATRRLVEHGIVACRAVVIVGGTALHGGH